MKRTVLVLLCILLAITSSGCAKNAAVKDTAERHTEAQREIDGQDLHREEKSEVANIMDRLWELENPDDFVIALMAHLQQKTNYGRDLSALSPAERVVYITQTLEMEVNNGGFDQFFYNSSGDYANELVSAFQTIGADTTAGICQKAVSVFGRDIPVDRCEREEMMDEVLSDEIAEMLDECDGSFYDYEDDLAELTYRYVLENKDQFN